MNEIIEIFMSRMDDPVTYGDLWMMIGIYIALSFGVPVVQALWKILTNAMKSDDDYCKCGAGRSGNARSNGQGRKVCNNCETEVKP